MADIGMRLSIKRWCNTMIHVVEPIYKTREVRMLVGRNALICCMLYWSMMINK